MAESSMPPHRPRHASSAAAISLRQFRASDKRDVERLGEHEGHAEIREAADEIYDGKFGSWRSSLSLRLSRPLVAGRRRRARLEFPGSAPISGPALKRNNVR